MEYRIWARFENGSTEVVDRCTNEGDASYNAREYQHAYGPNTKIWVGRLKDEPGRDECGANFHAHNAKFHPQRYR